MGPHIQAFFDQPTNTITYLLGDPGTKDAAVIDPVLDWDHKAGTADIRSAEALLAAAEAGGWRIAHILETHAHADHLSAAPFIKARTGAPIGIGARITEVQRIFRPVFNLQGMAPDGADFDLLFEDGSRFRVGHLEVEVMHLPGHTPACVGYHVRTGNEASADVFVGDTLFMHDYGTARCDFPGGDARTLYRSIQRLLALPPETRLWMCHDYKAPGRDQFAWQSTVAEQRASNPHVKDGKTEEEFVAFRTQRDTTLAAPALLLPSIQVNVRAGRFPAAESNGVRYLKVPVTATAAAILD
ncbi:MBL fold metallo-hydrolase [Roseococcus sp. YIM B11640]|uniref:MBL fold metallo-hydrolase n=1 Tax=Roseococcus sp. YIM B11640 TaxID=3133973 RepID=UPI003C7C8823